MPGKADIYIDALQEYLHGSEFRVWFAFIVDVIVFLIIIIAIDGNVCGSQLFAICKG